MKEKYVYIVQGQNHKHTDEGFVHARHWRLFFFQIFCKKANNALYLFIYLFIVIHTSLWASPDFLTFSTMYLGSYFNKKFVFGGQLFLWRTFVDIGLKITHFLVVL